MKRNLLLLSFVAFVLGLSLNPAFAAIQKETPHSRTNVENATRTEFSVQQTRKVNRLKNRMGRWEKKFQKKMERKQHKGKPGDRVNLGFMLGLIVLLTGGLFIALGLIIPAIGIIFLIIGVIIAFAGLLLWIVLGGISVEVS